MEDFHRCAFPCAFSEQVFLLYKPQQKIRNTYDRKAFIVPRFLYRFIYYYDFLNLVVQQNKSVPGVHQYRLVKNTWKRHFEPGKDVWEDKDLVFCLKTDV
ncbi:MAG: hypothetical protein K6G81_13140 [Lachnospiraceae bacterium]|nr:hypothetical protein [Lachnospiraceae bacterium]